MGSLEVGVKVLTPSSSKRAPLLLRSSSSSLSRGRARLARFVLFEKVDYLQWIITFALFFFLLLLFQMFLPTSVENSEDSSSVDSDDWVVNLKRVLNFSDFQQTIRFDPSKLLAKFDKNEGKDFNFSSFSSRPRVRSGIRKPQLALVFADQSVGSEQLVMINVAVSLLEIGYALQVYSLEDGPMHVVWRSIGVHVTILQNISAPESAVDWLNYDGILVNSLEAKGIISRFTGVVHKLLLF